MSEIETQTALGRDVIHQLIERHDWRLLDAESFLHQLLARTQALAVMDRETLLKVAINLYCETWHAACREDGPRRARAYSELARYLYDRARHKYGDAEMAQEITHDAIILVAEQIDNCQKPGAFMAFALLKLWNAATVYFRQRDRYLQRTETMAEQEETTDETGVGVEAATATPAEQAIAHDQTSALFARVGELMQQAPRAEQQFKAVLLKFLYAYSDEEIAQELATEVQNVHVLRSRGLKRLREDPVLRQLFEEL